MATIRRRRSLWWGFAAFRRSQLRKLRIAGNHFQSLWRGQRRDRGRQVSVGLPRPSRALARILAEDQGVGLTDAFKQSRTNTMAGLSLVCRAFEFPITAFFGDTNGWEILGTDDAAGLGSFEIPIAPGDGGANGLRCVALYHGIATQAPSRFQGSVSVTIQFGACNRRIRSLRRSCLLHFSSTSQ